MTLTKDFNSLSHVFAAAVENADALICVTDENGVIEYVNPAFCDVMNDDLEKINAQDIDFIYAERGINTSLNKIWSRIKSKKSWRGELIFQNKRQETTWYQTTVSPVLNEMQELTHCVWVQFDITEQKELERTKLKSENKLQSILDNIPAYIFSKNSKGQYTYANKMLTMLHALNVDDIIGKTDFDLFPEEAAQTFSKNDKIVFEKNKTVRALEDGGIDDYGIKRSYLSVKCPLTNEANEVEELLGMSVDISEQQRLENALRESEEKLSSILDNMKARVYIKDHDLKYTYANEELCNILSTDRINMLGKNDFDLFDLETAVGFRTTDEEVFKTKQKITRMETSIEPDTKEKRYYWSVKLPLLNAHGNPHSLLGISTDVTDQKQLEKALRQSEQQLSTILDNIKAHVYIKDSNYIYTYVNEDMCHYLGLSKKDVIGKSDIEIFGEDVSKTFHQSDKHVFDYVEDCTSIEKSCHLKTGEKYDFLSVKVPLINSLGNPYAILGISTDVTEQKRLEKELREMASTDVLTGINNRRHFIELCEREIHRAQRFDHNLSLIMLDLDHFKQINDTFGHAVGDRAIKAMTKICLKTLRTIDVIGRIGGEEFAILLPETDKIAACQIAQRIRAHAEHYTFDTDTDIVGKLTASFGVSSLLKEDKTPDDLLKRADIALYEAKSNGRNQVCEG